MKKKPALPCICIHTHILTYIHLYTYSHICLCQVTAVIYSNVHYIVDYIRQYS